MPAYVLHGPHIPDRLNDALEEGRVVFFCGVGISYPANLPDFEGLVRGVYKKLGYTVNASDLQKAALEQKQFDTALDLLERYRPNGDVDVRRTVAEILKPKLDLPGALDTHKAILTLGRTRNGKYRVLTTNFDPLFEIAKLEMKLTVRSYLAPLLPVPKLALNGLYYLHGLIEDADNPELLRNLVLTSGDFGRAYLQDRWASRFASELFRNFTVCFVGYSIGDPVMRYMMDALAADKRAGEPSIEMYAFAGYEPGEQEKKRNEWLTKNVTPILYPIIDKKHDLLHRTLHEWANTYRDGIEGRKMLIQQHAAAEPLDASTYNFAVERVLWALNDEQAAKYFATMTPCPPLKWLRPLSGLYYRHEDLKRFGVPPKTDVDDKLQFSFLRRYTPYDRAPPMVLVGRGQTIAGYDGVMAWLAEWLCRHINDYELPGWFIDHGNKLHPYFAETLRRRLDKLKELKSKGDDKAAKDELARLIGTDERADPSEPMRTLLQLYVDGRVRPDSHDMDMYSWRHRFAISGPTPELRMLFRDLLTPCVIFRKRSDMLEGRPEQKEAQRVKDIVGCEIALAADHVHVALRDNFKGQDWKQILPDFLPSASALLKDAMDLTRVLGDANDRFDASYYHQPSISEHEQNRHFRDWTALVELCRDGWLAVSPTAPTQGLAYAMLWFATPYPIFKRLAFFCAAQPGTPVPIAMAVEWLTQDGGWWLWSVETQRETMRLLASLGARLDKDQRGLLEAAMLRGSPREMYKPDITPEDLKGVTTYQTWHVLKKLRIGAPLGTAAQARLDQLEKENPDFKLDPNEMDEFPFSMSTGLGRRTSKKQPSPTGLKDLVAWLRNPPKLDFLEEDDWDDRCRSDFGIVARALLELAGEGVWPADRWRTALQVWTEKPKLAGSWRALAPALAKMPEAEFNDIAHTLGYWLQNQAKRFGLHEASFFVLCERLLAVPDPEKKSSMEPVTDALNSPGGYATQSLLSWWYRQKLADGKGLDDKVRGIFTKLSDRKVSLYRHARIFLTAHVVALFRVDEKWTREHLLPLFDWSVSTEDATRAWAGFLWSPVLFLPWLTVVKDQFLATATHYDDLRDRDGDQYAHLLAFVAMNPADIFTTEELAAAVKSLPADGREQLLIGVVNSLKGAGDKKDEFWRNRVVLFMEGVWPQDVALKSEAVATRMAQICVEAGDEFPHALKLLGGWLQPIDFVYSIFSDLEEEGLCTRFPAEAVDFMDRLTTAKMKYLSQDFGTCLHQIAAANSALKEDDRYKRLLGFYQVKRG